MTHLYRNKYRIPSTRLPTRDYASEGAYFITICTHHRVHYFGEIAVETPGMASLRPTMIGQTAEREWHRTMMLRPDMHLKSGEFVVMPNHIHGILIIGSNPFNQGDIPNQNRFGPQSNNLASIIRGYKSAVTMYARENNIRFDWQSRFHDHVIRSYEEYERIARYIRNNPQQWAADKFRTDNGPDSLA